MNRERLRKRSESKLKRNYSAHDPYGEEKWESKRHIKSYKLLKETKRYSGITTLESIRSLQKKIPIQKKKTMGGNGAAMRTMPIGLFWYNDIEKVIKTSIIVSNQGCFK